MTDNSSRSLDNASQPVPHMAAARPRSAMAVAGLVLGIIGLVFLPILFLNFISPVLGILGLIFACIGLSGCLRGKRTGKGMAIAALVLNIIVVIVVFGSCSSISSTTGGSAVSSVSTPSVAGDSAAGSAQATADATNLTVGSSVTLRDGLVITVEAVTGGLQKYDGSPMTEARVSYRNDGSKDASFNWLNWKMQDTQGVVDSATLSTSATDSLGSGTLVPGGTVSGTVCFDGDPVKVFYYDNMFSSSATAAWNVA